MTVRRAIFDNGQTGQFPAISVSRNQATLDGLGVAVAANEPRYGPAAGSSQLGVLTLQQAGSKVYSYLGSNRFDDGTEYFVARNGTDSQIDFWIGDPVSGAATVSKDYTRVGPGVDVLVGTAIENATKGYDVRSILGLPNGVVLFHCERDEDISGWDIRGYSVVACRLSSAGTIDEWQVIFDAPRLNSNAAHDGVTRGENPAIHSYYPSTQAQYSAGVATEVWIPVVDYLGAPKPGGQLHLIKATAAEGDWKWTFESAMLIDEEDSVNGRHFHCGGWTPNGILLSIGDGTEDNQCRVVRPDDWSTDEWDNWDTATYTTGVVQVHGTPAVADDLVGGNQFWGMCPGRDINTLVVATDLEDELLMEVTIPSDLTDDVQFDFLFGRGTSHPGDQFAGGTSSILSGSVQRPMPERSTDMVALYWSSTTSGVDYSTFPGHSRVIVGRDWSFQFISREPDPSVSQRVALYDGELVIPSDASNGGIYSIPLPSSVKNVRRLQVNPGATQLCLVDGDGELLVRNSLLITTPVKLASYVWPAGTPNGLAGTAFVPPGSGPVYYCRPDGTSGDNREFLYKPQGTDTYSRGSETIHIERIAIATLTAVVWHDVHYTQNTGGNAGTCVNRQELSTCYTQFREHMNVHDISAWDDTCSPQSEIRVGSAAPARTDNADYLVQINSYTLGTNIPYPLPQPQSTTAYPDEQITLTVPTPWAAPPCTIALDLMNPLIGMDWSWGEDKQVGAVPNKATLYLCTLWGDASNYVEIRLDLENRELDFAVTSSTGNGTITVTNIYWQSQDQLQCSIALDTADMTVAALCGGSAEDGIKTGTDTLTLGTAVTEIRFGDNDFTEIPPLEVRSVTIDGSRVLTGSDGLGLVSALVPAQVRGRGRSRDRGSI